MEIKPRQNQLTLTDLENHRQWTLVLTLAVLCGLALPVSSRVTMAEWL